MRFRNKYLLATYYLLPTIYCVLILSDGIPDGLPSGIRGQYGCISGWSKGRHGPAILERLEGRRRFPGDGLRTNVGKYGA